jgi:hypothetical protein
MQHVVLRPLLPADDSWRDKEGTRFLAVPFQSMVLGYYRRSVLGDAGAKLTIADCSITLTELACLENEVRSFCGGCAGSTGRWCWRFLYKL